MHTNTFRGSCRGRHRPPRLIPIVKASKLGEELARVRTSIGDLEMGDSDRCRADDEGAALVHLLSFEGEGRQPERLPQLRPRVGQQRVGQVKALGGLCLLFGVLGGESVDRQSDLLEVVCEVSKLAGLRCAAFRAGDEEPLGHCGVVGSSDAWVDDTTKSPNEASPRRTGLPAVEAKPRSGMGRPTSSSERIAAAASATATYWPKAVGIVRPAGGGSRPTLRDVEDVLALPDGRRVDLGDQTTGGSKNHTRFGALDGQPVVVKVQAHHGRLRNEEAALRFAAAHRLPCPDVVATGTTANGTFFLILTREHGHRTTTPQGWARMGQDYAKLAATSTTDCELVKTEPQAFADGHLERLDAVSQIIDTRQRVEIAAAVEHLRRNPWMSLTHGDPGSGNYLDYPSGGTILDWETAHVAPFGLDAGRGAFIALLDLTRTGTPHELHDAFVDGYRSTLEGDARLDDQTLRAATLVAALQFVHGRHTRPLRPDRTAQMAIDTLTEYLERSDRRTP